MMEWWYMVLAGLAGGIIGGMGMGGGTLLIPILTIILGMSQLDAQLINLVSFVPMAMITVIIFAKNGLLNIKKIMYVLPSALLFSTFGAVISGIIDTKLLRLIFGIFLILVSVFFLSKYFIDSFISMASGYRKGGFWRKISVWIEKKRHNLKSL